MEARRLLGERIRAVPRLRQRLHRAPPGCGRPYGAGDPAFEAGRHVQQASRAARTGSASSYAGTLYITVLSDPGGMTDAPVLAAALRRELPHRDQGPRPANLSALT